jgi:8-amino-7-oxononanoate synthase
VLRHVDRRQPAYSRHVSLEDEATQELDQLEAQGRRRSGLSGIHSSPAPICFSSNDYIGLASRKWSEASLATATGAGASRLIAGDHESIRVLECALGQWVGLPSALVFSSGYAANVGLLTALAGPDVEVFSDALNHASIIDGCRLSRARVHVYPHLDLRALAEALAAAPTGRRRLVVTESIFSMDGDQPDLRSLSELARRAGASLIVDEAHALGVVGPNGRGACAQAGVVPEVLVATFGKALGLAGAAVLTTPAVRELLWNRSRSLVFSTAISPLLAACATEAVELVAGGEGDERRARLAARWRLLGEAIPLLGRSMTGRDGPGPIASVVLGSEQAAVAAAEALLRRGVWVHPIRPPTVPPGTSRLRITLSSSHHPTEIERLAAALVAEGIALT